MHSVDVAISHGSVSSALQVAGHGTLLDYAKVFADVALIWLAAAVIALSGCVLGMLVYRAVQVIVRACYRSIRRRSGRGYAHLVTLDHTGATAKVVSLDRYRRRRRYPRNDPPTDVGGTHHDDKTAQFSLIFPLWMVVVLGGTRSVCTQRKPPPFSTIPMRRRP